MGRSASVVVPSALKDASAEHDPGPAAGAAFAARSGIRRPPAVSSARTRCQDKKLPLTPWPRRLPLAADSKHNGRLHGARKQRNEQAEYDGNHGDKKAP